MTKYGASLTNDDVVEMTEYKMLMKFLRRLYLTTNNVGKKLKK